MILQEICAHVPTLDDDWGGVVASVALLAVVAFGCDCATMSARLMCVESVLLCASERASSAVCAEICC